MKKTLTSLAIAATAIFSMSTSALALEFGPKVKWCSVSVDGIHESLLMGYSFATGDLDCKYLDGSKSSEPVALKVYSFGLQAGNCDMNLYAKAAGADLGLNIFKKDILQAFAGVEIFNPVNSVLKNKQKTLSASVLVDINNIGAAAVLAEATYGRGCAIGAKVNIGKLKTGKAYHKAVARHERMLERRANQNDNTRD